MSTLLLKLSGPLQSWGAESKFTVRQTRHEPSKSGVLGLLAAAQGRRRTDPIEDLAAINFGVRIDQPGRLLRDFHTAHNAEGQAMPLSYRYYLNDAIFLVGLEADEAFLQTLVDALREPTFPVYLGRRSCPPSAPLVLDVLDGQDLSNALRSVPWQAADWYKRKHRYHAEVMLELARDATSNEELDMPHELLQDVPLDFSPVRRLYGWRTVIRESNVRVPNDFFRGQVERNDATSTHDPFAALGGI
jgi:CRISPR system Cascade subunit CasD